MNIFLRRIRGTENNGFMRGCQGNNLNHEVRSSAAAAISQLGFISYDRDIRLHPVLIVRIQIDGERGRVYLAVW